MWHECWLKVFCPQEVEMMRSPWYAQTHTHTRTHTHTHTHTHIHIHGTIAITLEPGSNTPQLWETTDLHVCQHLRTTPSRQLLRQWQDYRAEECAGLTINILCSRPSSKVRPYGTCHTPHTWKWSKLMLSCWGGQCIPVHTKLSWPCCNTIL